MPKGNQILKSFKLKMEKKIIEDLQTKSLLNATKNDYCGGRNIQNKILSMVSYSDCVHFVWTTYNNSQRVNPFKNSVTLCVILSYCIWNTCTWFYSSLITHDFDSVQKKKKWKRDKKIFHSLEKIIFRRISFVFGGVYIVQHVFQFTINISNSFL